MTLQQVVQVSILVLVDAALRLVTTKAYWEMNNLVSILVLVDAALRHEDIVTYFADYVFQSLF